MRNQLLEAELLKLPSHERARLAELLIASLDEDDEILDAWADEAERRYEEIASGKVKAIPAEEVFEKLRNRHARPQQDSKPGGSPPGDESAV